MKLELGKNELELIRLALDEDLGGATAAGDVTSLATINEFELGEARFVAREDLRICGLAITRQVFIETQRRFDSKNLMNADPLTQRIDFEVLHPDGVDVCENTQLAVVRGPVRTLLSAERTALNFLQRLSGIATATAKLVAELAGTQTSLLDTRKTTPGYRKLEKYAVLIGGGVNHRTGLFDLFLIKNNHVDAVSKENGIGYGLPPEGAVREAIRRCQDYRQHHNLKLKIEAEVRNEAELVQALQSGAEIILLDNMSPDQVRAAVAIRKSMIAAGALLSDQVKFEASGGIKATNLRQYAETGVDFVSMGALTHSVKASDISLRISFGV